MDGTYVCLITDRLVNCLRRVRTAIFWQNTYIIYIYIIYIIHTYTLYIYIPVYIYVYMVQYSHYRPGVAQRVGRGIALLFIECFTRRGWVVSSTPRPHFIPPGKTRYPFYRRLCGPQGRSGRAENFVPTGIRSRTVQPVVMSGNGSLKKRNP